MIRAIFAAVAIIALVQPPVAFAQLSSENFVVEGSSLGAPNITNSASSTNFGIERESGGLYIFDEPVVVPSVGGGSSGNRRAAEPKPVKAVEEPAVVLSEPVLYGPRSANVGDPVSLSVRFDVSADQNSETYADRTVVFSMPEAAGLGTYQGNGVYTASFTAATSGVVRITATVDGIQVTEDIVGISDGVLNIELIRVEEPVEEIVDVCEDGGRPVSIQSPVEGTTVAFTLPAGSARSRIVEQTRSDYRLIVEIKPVSTQRVSVKQQQLTDAVALLTQTGNSNTLVRQPSQENYIEPLAVQPVNQGAQRTLFEVGDPDCFDEFEQTQLENLAVSNDADSDGDGIPDRIDPDNDNDGKPDDSRNAIIYAHKILCEDESMLPNWGNRGGPNLTRSSAEDWIANNPGCEFEQGAFFEWGEQSVRNPGDNRLGATGRGWSVVGPTNENGLAFTVVTDEQIQNNRHFWFREVLRPGYLTYTFRYDRSSYSAEMYCHTDVKNYDNFDRIDGIKTNDSFSCIVWSVLGGGSAPNDGINPEPDSDSDGVPDRLDLNNGFPDTDTDGDGIPDESDPNPNVFDRDFDGDGLPDIVDTDDDGDGLNDDRDDDSSTPLNPGQLELLNGLTDDVIIFFQDAEEVEINTDIFTDGKLIPPIEISVLDETGTPVVEFEEPIDIDLFNPEFVDAEDILVMQPSGIDNEWFVLPAERNGDKLTVTLKNPGEIFIWLLVPETAEASDGESSEESEGFFGTIEVNKTAVDTATSIGLITGIFLGFVQLSGAPFSITHWSRNFGIALRSIFAFITFRRKPKPWGTVYDSSTKAPLDPVIVELFDENSTSVAQAITDLDGRYGFLVPEGMYELKVRKTNYIFPSKQQFLSGTDVLYDNLYKGGMVQIDDTVAWDIPMDPVAFDWNQYEKLRTKQTKFFRRIDPIVVGLSNVLFYAGATLMFWQYLSVRDTTTLLLALLYLALLLIRIFRNGPPLYGTVLKDDRVLPFALVKIMMNDRVVAQKVADEHGRYVAIVPPGEYSVQVEERVNETQMRVVDSLKVSAKRGYINKTLSF